MTLVANKQAVEQAVTESCQKAGRSANAVQVVAVTKYVDQETTQALLDTGVRHLGENRADKFLAKVAAFQGQDVVWHYIGSLQRRKVKDVINHIDYFHALDSLSLAKEIQKRADKSIKCFLQLNISGEESKHGFSVSDLDSILPELAELDKLEIVGLMTMAPFGAEAEELVAIFGQLRQVRDKINAKQLKNMPMTELSMGMSGDFDIAIQEGATFVRIGSLFFE
jgi:pyridoxal phosphate enzyme (YggS family)